MTERIGGKESFHPTERFTTKVRDYALFRPRYPHELIDILTKRAGLAPGMIIADIGSGTGILSQLLLDEGCVVYGVEPNTAMRTKAEELLGLREHFLSIAGRAESTTLATGSIDMIVIGQAFHWFDLVPTKTEFLRILRPQGYLCLVWNRRDPEGGEFEVQYRKLVEECCPSSSKVKELGPTEDEIAAFFSGPYEHIFLPNHQDLDFEGLKGRFLSASYAPGESEPNYISAMEGLERLFLDHSQNGIVRFHYVTEIFLGVLMGDRSVQGEKVFHPDLEEPRHSERQVE
jgi:SAM-dependent methyltransferase